MSYNVVFDVPLPVEVYDGLHAAVRTVTGADDIGLVVHVGRATDGGFQVLEIWRSKEAFDGFNAEIWPKLTALLGQELPPPAGVEFELRGLIVAPKDGIDL